ncbi:MAG: hypothetical protein AB7W47_17200 [Calditrichaceae bacterium]
MINFLQNFEQKGLLKKCDPLQARASNTRSLKQLRQKFEHPDERVRFLAYYDAVFRLLELKLSTYGLALSDQPHATFRKIFRHLYPDINISETDLAGLSRTRHRVKKEYEKPLLSDLAVIKNIFEKIQKISEKI